MFFNKIKREMKCNVSSLVGIFYSFLTSIDRFVNQT